MNRIYMRAMCECQLTKNVILIAIFICIHKLYRLLLFFFNFLKQNFKIYIKHINKTTLKKK